MFRFHLNGWDSSTLWSSKLIHFGKTCLTTGSNYFPNGMYNIWAMNGRSVRSSERLVHIIHYKINFKLKLIVNSEWIVAIAKYSSYRVLNDACFSCESFSVNGFKCYAITSVQCCFMVMAQFQAKEEEEMRPNPVIIFLVQQNAFVLCLIEITQCVSYSVHDEYKNHRHTHTQSITLSLSLSCSPPLSPNFLLAN